jgi:hypothetical protein
MFVWERHWRANGSGSAVFVISAYAIYDDQPKVDLSGGTA